MQPSPVGDAPFDLKAALDHAKQRAINNGTFSGLPSDHSTVTSVPLDDIRAEKDPAKRARLAWKRNQMRKRQRYNEYRQKHAIPEAVAADRARKWRIQRYGTAASRARRRESRNLGLMEIGSISNQIRLYRAASR